MDLSKTRYETYEELYRYCYLVASTVGLMCRQIFGYRNASTRDYAVNLGIALQLTNILRDIKEDARRGRIYIPARTFADSATRRKIFSPAGITPEFVNLMRFECDRASNYFDIARAALGNEDKRFFFAARIMWSIYAHTLERIKRSNYNVFERRISVPGLLKVLITFRYWLSNTLKYSWLGRYVASRPPQSSNRVNPVCHRRRRPQRLAAAVHLSSADPCSSPGAALNSPGACLLVCRRLHGDGHRQRAARADCRLQAAQWNSSG